MKFFRRYLFAGAFVLFLITSHILILKNQDFILLRSQPLISLTENQINHLKALPEIELTFYLRNNPALKKALLNLIRPLSVYGLNLQIQWVNPDLDPVRAQSENITAEGQTVIRSGTEKIKLDVPSLTGIVNALLGFKSGKSAFILHLQGHGERGFLDDSAGSWQALYRQLQASNDPIAVFKMGDGAPLPQNTEVLIIADPEKIEQDNEIKEALQNGVNLIYTTDTQRRYLPEFLKEISGLKIVDGTVISAKSQQYGLENPEFLVVENLGDTDITRNLNKSPLLIGSVAFAPKNEPENPWKRTVLLWSDELSWAETGDLRQAEYQPESDTKGALALGWLLWRDHPKNPEQKQYLVILGDSDWVQSNYFQLAGNRLFFQAILAVLRPQNVDKIINQELSDQFIQLSPERTQILGLVLFLFPIIFYLLSLWRHFRKRF